MRSLWKYVVPVAVVLPLIAFVAGSLLATADDEPPARVPIELRDDGTDGPADPVPGGVVSPEPYIDEDDDGADDRAEEHDDGGRDLRGDDDGDDDGDDGEAEDDDDGGDDD